MTGTRIYGQKLKWFWNPKLVCNNSSLIQTHCGHSLQAWVDNTISHPVHAWFFIRLFTTNFEARACVEQQHFCFLYLLQKTNTVRRQHILSKIIFNFKLQLTPIVSQTICPCTIKGFYYQSHCYPARSIGTILMVNIQVLQNVLHGYPPFLGKNSNMQLNYNFVCTFLISKKRLC